MIFKNNLHVVFQIDDFESLNFKTDSTLLLIKEAFKRGYKIFCYSPNDLIFCSRKIFARGYYVRFEENFIRLPFKKEKLDLSKVDIIFIRQNPPFNMFYLTSTYLLEMLPDKILFVNNPTGVRDSPEKILVTYFSHLIPDTLISRDLMSIQNFIEDYKMVVLKPLYSFGGTGIFILKKEDINLRSLLGILIEQSNEAFIIQKFIPEVFIGDIRILIIDGKIIGGFRRIPKKGDFRGNMFVGGKVEPYVLNNRDREICEEIIPILKERGLLFVGIDIINGFLIEINVTSPTGLHSMNKLYSGNIEDDFWNSIEYKFKQNYYL